MMFNSPYQNMYSKSQNYVLPLLIFFTICELTHSVCLSSLSLKQTKFKAPCVVKFYILNYTFIFS